MLTINIPGSHTLHLSHLVLDFNGTIACDGELLSGVAERLARLAETLDVHVITADTHGTVRQEASRLPCSLHVIETTGQDLAKRAFIEELGASATVALGNGRNDYLMLDRAELGIAIIGSEGACAELISQADVLCTSIEDGLDLLLLPDRLRATLRR